jgi:predicted amidophosphoribosyltransferase
LPAACPQCDGELRHRCPVCSAPIPSAFAIACEECGAEIRSPELFGTVIRKPGR